MITKTQAASLLLRAITPLIHPLYDILTNLVGPIATLALIEVISQSAHGIMHQTYILLLRSTPWVVEVDDRLASLAAVILRRRRIEFGAVMDLEATGVEELYIGVTQLFAIARRTNTGWPRREA